MESGLPACSESFLVEITTKRRSLATQKSIVRPARARDMIKLAILSGILVTNDQRCTRDLRQLSLISHPQSVRHYRADCSNFIRVSLKSNC